MIFSGTKDNPYFFSVVGYIVAAYANEMGVKMSLILFIARSGWFGRNGMGRRGKYGLWGMTAHSALDLFIYFFFFYTPYIFFGNFSSEVGFIIKLLYQF